MRWVIDAQNREIQNATYGVGRLWDRVRDESRMAFTGSRSGEEREDANVAVALGKLRRKTP